VADKIGFEEFFDFSDETQVNAFLKGGQDIITQYNQILQETKKGKADLSKATKQLTAALEAEEAVLQRANDTTKEGQETIIKAAQNTSVFTKQLKEQREEEARLNKEITDLKKKVEELSGAMSKVQGATEASTKAQKAAAGSIDELKKKVLDAKKAYEALGSSVDPIEKSKALENYAKLKQELDAVNKATSDAAKGNQLAAGSYNELEKEVNDLAKQYKNLPDALGKNKVKAEELRKTLYAKRQTLKDLDAQMNVNNRNVGNYAESLKEAALNSNLFGGKIAQAANGLKSLQGGLSTASKGFSSLKYAIVSTGIGALLIAFGLLVNLFTKFAPFADMLERAFAGIGAVIDVASRYLAEFAVSIMEAFANPKEALIAFGNSLKEFVLDRINFLLKGIKGLGSALSNLFKGNFKQAAKDAGEAFLDLNRALNPTVIAAELTADAFKKMTKEMQNAYTAASDLKGRMQDLADAQRVFGVTTTKNRGLVEQLILKSKDQTLSEKERLAALKEAGKIELEETAKAIKLAQEKLDIILDQNTMNSKLNKEQVANLTLVDGYLAEIQEKQGKLVIGGIQGKDLDEQAEAQKELQQIINESLNQQQEIKNRESKFKDKEADEDIKREAELGKELSRMQIDKSKTRMDILMAEAKKVDETYGSNLVENLGFTKENDKKAKAWFDSIDKRIKDHADANKAAEDKKTEDAKKAAEERDAIRKAEQQKAMEVVSAAGNAIFDFNKEKRDQELADIQNERAIELELAGENARQKDQINKEFDRRERKLKREAAKADKEQALFNIAISTAVAAMSSLASTPLPAGAVLLALTLALGAIQAAAVLARPLPKYAEGTTNAKEGFAITDERGPELRESRGKFYLGSGKGPRLTYLQRGDKIHTAEATKRMLEGQTAADMLLSYQMGAYKLSGIKDDSIDYDRLSKKVSGPIVYAIENKPVASLYADKRGLSLVYRKGNSEVEYLNTRFGIRI
jgi:hypothetical protein